MAPLVSKQLSRETLGIRLKLRGCSKDPDTCLFTGGRRMFRIDRRAHDINRRVGYEGRRSRGVWAMWKKGGLSL